MKLGTLAVAALLVCVSAGSRGFAQQGRQAQKEPSAETLYNRQMRDPVWKLDYTGEDFGWRAGYGMDVFLTTYKKTGDTSYLDYGVKYYDALIAKMAVGPDGYKGWIGPFEYNNKYWCDAHVSDAVLFDGILDFSAHVMRDPKLKEKYGAKALEYVNEAKKDLFEKWDARGTWHEDGPFGFYTTWDHYGLPGQLQDWKVVTDNPEVVAQSGGAHPFNKNIDVGVCAIRIWQVTGEEKYKQRAEKLFGFMKSRMQAYKGAYHWNYWEPAYIGDLGLTAEDIKKGEWNPGVSKTTMRSWINVHGHRNYQSNEVANIVIAYNAGIVFTEADLRGIIQTNLKVMWNGDENKPLYANSNVDLMGLFGKPESFAPAPKGDTRAGELWAPLAQFDATVRKLASRQMAQDAPPGFERREAKGQVEIPKVYSQFPLGNVRTITMACVLPSVFPGGQEAAIACKLLEKGDLEVALYSADGKTSIATLKSGPVDGGHDGREGVLYFMFKGTDPASGKAFDPGNYRIRWTVKGDGYREFPITIEPKK